MVKSTLNRFYLLVLYYIEPGININMARYSCILLSLLHRQQPLLNLLKFTAKSIEQTWYINLLIDEFYYEQLQVLLKKNPTRLCSSEQEKYRTIIQQYNTFKFSKKKRSICVQYRIDKLAEAGLDIWATELTVDEADDVKKADALGNLLTMYFSHPSVGGVILWHFWNESLWHPNENLFDGPDIKVKFHTR